MTTERIFTDCAFDLETLALTPDAVITSGAFVPFNRTDDDSFETLLARSVTFMPPVEVQIRMGRRVQAATVKWRAAVNPGGLRRDLDESLDFEFTMPGEFGAVLIQETLLEAYVAGVSSRCVSNAPIWCRGSQFDAAIWDHMMDQLRIRPGDESYRRWRDSRTAYDVLGFDHLAVEYPEDMTPHIAAHDAAFEALLIQSAVRNQSA